jgi:RNA:NAD 2'-phosphotransferase (TPT1/KptA family)
MIERHGQARSRSSMIVFHGTTIDRLPGIQREGLRPGSYVARDRALASDYAWHRAITLGADACVIIELDVPDAAVVDAQSWWWARGQLLLPVGCPPSCIVLVDDSDPRPHSVV